MSFMSSKIGIKVVRSFSIGFKIFSPKWNGLCIEFHVACFTLIIWNRGHKLFNFRNYWNG